MVWELYIAAAVNNDSCSSTVWEPRWCDTISDIALSRPSHRHIRWMVEQGTSICERMFKAVCTCVYGLPVEACALLSTSTFIEIYKTEPMVVWITMHITVFLQTHSFSHKLQTAVCIWPLDGPAVLQGAAVLCAGGVLMLEIKNCSWEADLDFGAPLWPFREAINVHACWQNGLHGQYTVNAGEWGSKKWTVAASKPSHPCRFRVKPTPAVCQVPE